MKDDVEIPPEPPRKRRQLEDPGQTLDKWLAVWASDESLPPSARKRAQAERDRRKALVPDVFVGVIVGEEGMTPAQRDGVLETVMAAGPTRLVVRAPRMRHLRVLLNAAAADESVGLLTCEDDQELVRSSTSLVAAPKEAEKPDVVEGVWEAVRYAKHRKVPVRVVMQDGSVT